MSATSPMEHSGRVHHPVVARLMPWFFDRAHARGQGEHRRELLAGLTGSILEVGAGNGSNFPHYPAAVTEVVAVEPESYLRGLAEEAARRARFRVRVVDGLAERLPAEDAAFDAGVASLVLCSVADPRAAIAELFRVIRPGGSLRFYEHVRSPDQGLARVQQVLDRLLWPRVSGGCHCGRDTGSLIEAAGFLVEVRRRLVFRPHPFFFHLSPHILGRARRP